MYPEGMRGLMGKPKKSGGPLGRDSLLGIRRGKGLRFGRTMYYNVVVIAHYDEDQKRAKDL